MKKNKANLDTCTTKIETVNLSQLRVNEANPRTISKEKFDKLVGSILVLPKMLNLRPIVIDDLYTILGGNMRYRALVAIENMKNAELVLLLSKQRDYQRKTDAERVALVNFWGAWRENPTAQIIRASELSEQECKEFIIKDNVGYGTWDMDMLANEWDSEDLDAWGVDVWQPLEFEENKDNDASAPIKNKNTTRLTIDLNTDVYVKVVNALEAFNSDLSIAIVEALGIDGGE